MVVFGVGRPRCVQAIGSREKLRPFMYIPILLLGVVGVPHSAHLVVVVDPGVHAGC